LANTAARDFYRGSRISLRPGQLIQSNLSAANSIRCDSHEHCGMAAVLFTSRWIHLRCKISSYLYGAKKQGCQVVKDPGGPSRCHFLRTGGFCLAGLAGSVGIGRSTSSSSTAAKSPGVQDCHQDAHHGEGMLFRVDHDRNEFHINASIEQSTSTSEASFASMR
jgi:hypothetical protein